MVMKKMIIQTKYHGELEIDEKKIIHFEEGIPSFEDEKQFIILPLEDSPFLILQSVKTASLGFVLISPFEYFPDYDAVLPDAAVKKLKIENENEVVVFTILTVHEPFENTTANLRAPIVVNTKAQLGKQVILNNDKYTTKHRIINKSPASIGEED